MPRQKNAEKEVKGSPSKAKERIGRLAPYVESVLKERYGCYPESHPLSQYVKSIVERMETGADKGRISVSVTRGWEEANACALPNGAILISDRMFKFCETEDEIAFVINHERSHIKGGHAERMCDNQSTKDIILTIGSLRSQEYEADVQAAIESGEGPFNPHGGAVFLNRINEMEKECGVVEDIGHGSSLLRILALDYTARIVDMPSLSHALTPLPQDMLRSIESDVDPWKTILRDSLDETDPQKLHLAREALAKKCGVRSALSLMGPIYKRYNRIKQHSGKKYNGASLSAKMRMEFERKILKILLGKIDSLINKEYGDLDKEGKEVVRALVLELCAGVPLSEMHLKGEDHFGLFDSFSKLLLGRKSYQVMKIMGEFSSNFPEELVLERSPKKFIGSIINMLSEGGWFSDRKYSLVVNILMKDLEKAYRKKGAIDIDWGEIETECSIDMILDTSVDENAEAIAIIDISAKNLSEENKAKIVRNLFSRVEFDPKDLPEGWSVMLDKWKKENLPEKYLEAKEAMVRIAKRKWEGSMTTSLSEGKEVPEEDKYPFSEALRILGTGDLKEIEYFLDSIWEDMSIGKKIKEIVVGDISDSFLRGWDNEQHREFVDALRSKEGILGVLHIISKFPSCTAQLECIWFMETACGTMQTPEELAEIKEDLKKYGFYSEPEGKALMGKLFESSASRWADVLPRGELFRQLKRSVEILKPHEFMRAYILGAEIDRGSAVLGYDELLAKILDKYSFDTDNASEAEELLTVCAFLGDYDLKSQVLRSVLSKQIPKLGAGNAKKLLFGDPRLDGVSLNEMRERIINEEILSPESLGEAIDEAVVFMTKKESRKTLGKAIVGNTVMGELLKDKDGALKLFLKCAEDDFELRKATYHVWEAVGDRLEYVMPLSTLYERMYNIDFLTKQLIVQNLLMGKNGVLIKQSSRKKTVDWVLDYFVQSSEDESEKRLMEFLREILGKLAEKSDVSTMYFLLSPLILDRILVRPKNKMTWGEFLDRMAGEHYGKIRAEATEDVEEQHYAFLEEGEKEKKILETIDYLSDYYEIRDLRYVSGRDAVLEKIEGFGPDSTIPIDTEESERHLLQSVRVIEKLSKYIESEAVKDNGKRILKPMEFVRLVASHLGSPGVRFLQTLGLYVDLPDEYREEFDKVYDSMRGQPKLSAFHTLKREWEGLSGEVAEMRAPVGAGSLLTVYEVKTAEGEKEVVKVLNPNASFHTESMCELIESAFKAMKKHEGLAVPVLRDIKTWINEDISFEDSFEKDRRFRDIHSGWNAEDSAYSIYVPETRGKENKYYIREEFVEGKNLTQWDSLVEEGHNMKDIMSTVVKNSVIQLVDGQVHSDLHPGNIRITSDKRVCYLDRNYYIEIDDADRQFILGLESSLEDREELAGKIARYFAGEDDPVLQKKIAEKIGDDEGDPAHLVAGALVEVRNRGYDVPLKVTLILKNILSLDRLAKRAGFSGITEAYLYENK